VVEFVEDKFWLLPREQAWMNETRCFDSAVGYNVCEYADSRQGQVTGEATKALLRLKGSGKNHPFYGKKLSASHVQNLSDAHKKPWSKKRRAAGTDFSFINEEWRQAVSERTQGEKNPFYGKKQPRELLPFLADKANLGRHIRWHVNRGMVNPSCTLCETI